MVLGETGVGEVRAEDDGEGVPDPIAELRGERFGAVEGEPVT